MSGILRARFLVLMNDPNCVRRKEHIVLKCLSIDSGLRWSCKSSSPRIIHNGSMPHDNDGLICSQISASSLSSKSIEF